MTQSSDSIFNTGYQLYNDNKVKFFGIVDAVNYKDKGYVEKNGQNQVYIVLPIQLPITISRIINLNSEWLLQDALSNEIGKAENHKYFTPATMCYNRYTSKSVSFGVFVDETFYNNVFANSTDKGLYLTYSIDAIL